VSGKERVIACAVEPIVLTARLRNSRRAMQVKKTRQKRQKVREIARRSRVLIGVALVLSLVGIWAMLAHSAIFKSGFSKKGKNHKEVSAESFNSNSPSKEYIYAGGKLIATEEPNPSGSLAAPANFKATADTAGQIVLTWDQVQNATRYEVDRGGTLSGSFFPITPTNQTAISYTDSVLFNTTITYLYKVRASDGTNWSAFSNLDLATTIAWTDDPIQRRLTTVKAQHLLELRNAVNAVRTAAEKSTVTNWQPGVAQQQSIKAVHITELRSYLDEALGAINPPAQPGYTDPNLTGGGTTQIKMAHVDELRRRVRHRSTPP